MALFDLVWTQCRLIPNLCGLVFSNERAFQVSRFWISQNTRIRVIKSQEGLDNMNYNAKCNSLMC